MKRRLGHKQETAEAARTNKYMSRLGLATSAH